MCNNINVCNNNIINNDINMKVMKIIMIMCVMKYY